MLCHDVARREVVQVRGIAGRTRFEPALIEIVRADRFADDAERMNVGARATLPADAVNAELTSGVRGADEILLVDAEPMNQTHEGRARRFAHANGADLIGLDELDLAQLALQVLAQHGRRQPPGGAATNDHDFRQRLHGRFTSPDSRATHRRPPARARYCNSNTRRCWPEWPGGAGRQPCGGGS